MHPREINQISALGLAHCGDAVFELLVRSWLCDSGKLTTKQLHRATVSYVCAPAQAARADRMLPLLTEDELAQYKRGRNAHVHMIPKTPPTSSTRKQPVWNACSARCICPEDWSVSTSCSFSHDGGAPCRLMLYF